MDVGETPLAVLYNDERWIVDERRDADERRKGRNADKRTDAGKRRCAYTSLLIERKQIFETKSSKVLYRHSCSKAKIWGVWE